MAPIWTSLQKMYVFRFILKRSTVGLFLSKAALSPLREFHRFADALTKLLDPYLPGFPCGTVSKFDYADLRTLRGAYGTTNLHRYPGAKPCNVLYVYCNSLYSILLSTGNQCNSIKARDIEPWSRSLSWVTIRAAEFEPLAIQKQYI